MPFSDRPPEEAVIHKGLDGIYVKESTICFIDGEGSRLYYRGYNIEELVQKSNFEEVAYLLLYGVLPRQKELDDFSDQLRERRKLPDSILRMIASYPKSSQPMDVLRTLVSALGMYDTSPTDRSPEGEARRVIDILAKAPTAIAAYDRMREGLRPVEPKDGLAHGPNFLYMLQGSEPEEYDARVMDAAMLLHAEHEMNASAFACLVTASTLSDMYSAITSGIGTLLGPLHGGANIEALKMVIEVGSPDRAKDYVEKALAEKRKIMGFGHRVYKTYDPRYRILKEMAGRLAEVHGMRNLYDTAVAIEEESLKHLASKNVFPNIDSYSGVVFHMLGVHTDLFTTIFAMGRIAGWGAHVIEYIRDNRLIRPKAYYRGRLEIPYVPMGER